MEYIVGPIVAILFSLGYTEVKMKNHRKEYVELKERVEVMEGNLGRNMLSAMIPMSKSIKELQETVGMR